MKREKVIKALLNKFDMMQVYYIELTLKNGFKVFLRRKEENFGWAYSLYDKITRAPINENTSIESIADTLIELVKQKLEVAK
jgi:dTDP-4-amino-4,6-dideoxygalactose transaminase